MRNPEIQDPTEFQYYVQKNGIRSNWEHPSEADLVRSLNTLHQFTRQLVTEKERIQESLAGSQRKLGTADLKIWILMLALGAQTAVIGWLVKFVLARIH